MLRALTLLLALLSLTSSASSKTTPKPVDASSSSIFVPGRNADGLLQWIGVQNPTIAAIACCKVCTVGKACGNTCISRDKTCHVGQGCACDG